MELQNLRLEIADRIATVTVSREKALNALNSDTLSELRTVFLDFRRNDGVGGVIVTGAGEKAFIAGADIKEMADYQPLQARDFSLRTHHIFELIETLGKPVVAAINGFALGGGCELAMACHLRVASETARLGQPEVKLGIMAGAGGTQRLARLVGKGRALEILLTGEMISAQEAYRIGLANHVVPQAELIPTCKNLIRQMLKNGPLALRYTIEAVHNGLEMALEDGLFLESTLFGMCFATEDMKEGTRAFVEKRPAEFRGK
ncbi:MAG TPA: enoyl-CoA hydratase-related protein [Acidobacteriota bacterium]|nr:enoyl-CoA hydratase-related protein [Acidobacteriota bacterium]